MVRRSAGRSLRRDAVVLALLAVVVSPSAFRSQEPAEDAANDEQPRKIGLAERAATRLAQIDITAIGPPDVINSLTAEDFSIRVQFTKIREFEIDRMCGTAGHEPIPNDAAQADPGSPPVRATYLFYFDQPHLTLSGRQRALDVAEELIERLVVPPSQGMIVSNADTTAVVQPLTSDRKLLIDGLHRLAEDRSQWSMYAELEESRVADVIDSLNDTLYLHRAMAQARLYQKEEYWRTDRNLRRLSVTLERLVGLTPPKIAIYFADTIRSNPGEHYLSFFGEGMRKTEPTLAAMQLDATQGNLAFDLVTNQAAAQGIRVYSVEARGLTSISDRDVLSSSATAMTGASSTLSRARLSDTYHTLNSLATETGGRAFLHGVRPAKIARRILQDSSCIYLASFDPGKLPQDTPLRVIVKTTRPDVELRVRGRLVLQSDSSRRTSELLRAFSSPGLIPDPFAVRVGIIPTGFRRGSYSALLQISVPASPLQGATWDVGASLVSNSKVHDKASGRLTMSGSAMPLIFEHEVSFQPGDYEIVAVAQEEQSGLIASSQTAFEWPQLGGSEAVVGPIAVMQPAAGAFVRAGRTRSSGSLFVADADPVLADRPAAFVGLVCRGRRAEHVVVERALVGDAVHEFPVLELDSDAPHCGQVRDVVPSNTFRSGRYEYEVRVIGKGGQMNRRTREVVFLLPRPQPAPP